MTIPIDDTSIFQRFDLGQLPIGVYCVTPDGRLVYGNRPLRLLLDLSPDGPLNANAADFYADRNHRITVLNKAIAAESAAVIWRAKSFTCASRGEIRMSKITANRCVIQAPTRLWLM